MSKFKMKLMTAVVLISSLAFVTANADERIQVVTYDSASVVPIYTNIGNPTLIQFEEDESVVDTDKGMLGMGDAKAWSVGVKGNNVLLKPIANESDTKLIIVTTKRTYAFDIKTAPTTISPTLIVRFEYPDSKAKLIDQANKKHDVVQERLAKIASQKEGTLKANTNYVKKGDREIAPSQIYDDGHFTFMQFDSSRELPVVYKLLPDGTEALTNSHMVSDTGTIVVHETASDFILRYGTAVLAIRNGGFNPNGQLNVLGTSVPNAVRIKKDDLQ